MSLSMLKIRVRSCITYTIIRQFHKSRTKMEPHDFEMLARPKALVGCVQMTSQGNVEENLKVGKMLIQKSKARGAQMVFFPECFDHICESRSDTMKVCETIEGNIIKTYRQMAKENNMWLSLGGFHEKPINPTKEEEGRVYNTHLIINNDGEIKGKYSKCHLFDVDIKGGVRLKETDFTNPGKSIQPPVNTPVGNVGMAICYDMRFPELSLALTQQGATILTFPSAFTVATGMAHWEVLLRSRAIENQCYIIAAAQVGKHNAKRSSYGHAMIVDPWGCVIAECQDQTDICFAEIDLEYLQKRRLEMPVWNHRRHDLYGQIQTYTKGSIDEVEFYQFGQHQIKSSCVFLKSSLTIAFVNRKPVLPGHVLLSPIRPVERFADLTPAEVADLYLQVQKVSKVIQKQYGGSSLTIAIQDGPDAGQTVKHVHVHVMPRKAGDFKENDEIYEKLETHDKNVDPKQWRTEEDMAKEAGQLRTFF